MRYTLVFIVLQINTFVESCFFYLLCRVRKRRSQSLLPGRFFIARENQNEIDGTKFLFHVIDFCNFCNKIFFDFQTTISTSFFSVWDKGTHDFYRFY